MNAILSIINISNAKVIGHIPRRFATDRGDPKTIYLPTGEVVFDVNTVVHLGYDCAVYIKDCEFIQVELRPTDADTSSLEIEPNI